MNNSDLFQQIVKNATAKSTNRFPAIDISSECSVGCLFCFNQNEIPGTIHRVSPMTEYELDYILSIMKEHNPNIEMIQIGSGDKIWWGDPLAHPKFNEYLQKIIATFPLAEIHMDTSAYYLSDEILETLIEHNNKIRIHLSVNSMDMNTRSKFYQKPDNKGLLKVLKNLRIDYAYLKHFGNVETSIFDIESLLEYTNINNICYYKLHYTKYNNARAINIINETQNTFYESLDAIYRKHSHLVNVLHAEVQWLDNEYDKMSALFPENINFLDSVYKAISSNYDLSKTSCCTGESSYSYIKDLFEKNTVVKAKNNSYGGSITSSGLLMLQDILDAFDNHAPAKGFSYAIPSEIIDENGFDRVGMCLNEFKRICKSKYEIEIIDLQSIMFSY